MMIHAAMVLVSLLCILVSNGSAAAAVAGDCTMYVSANGADTNSGVSPPAPKTLHGASSISKPGDVICLLGGTYKLSSTFYPEQSGTANAWIVYKNYGDGDVQFVWAADASAADINMFHFYSRTFPAGKSYIEIRGLKFDGNNTASAALKCAGSHHLRFIDNTIQNTGESGIATKFCDYVTAIGNKIHHTGYNQGWSSGISYNSHQWFDTYPGFHSVAVNNFISGNYDNSSHQTEGNGIIIDLSDSSYNFNSANTPPVLVANNVVYGNGGRCIIAFVVTNVWVVNNTCYKNSLDLRQSSIGEFAASSSKNSYFINNIAQAWNNHWTYQQIAPNQNIVFYRNIFYGGATDFTYADPTQLINTNPLFVNPPPIEEAKAGQQAMALSSEQLGNGLSILSTSPALDTGIDPTTLPNLPREIVDGLRLYVLRDVVGTPRPCGAAFDIGAYEYPGSCVAPPPAPTGLTVKRVQ